MYTFKHFLLSAMCVATAAGAQAQTFRGPALPTAPQALRPQPALSRLAARPTNTVVYRPRTTVVYEWDEQTGTWDRATAQKATTTYNTLGLATEAVYADSTSNTPDTRATTSYDAQNRVTQILTDSWNNGAWAPASRLGFTYDAFGDVTNFKSEVRLGNQWLVMSEQRSTITRQAGTGLIQQIDTEARAFPATTFSNTRREIRTIANGRYSEILNQAWQNGAYVNESRSRNIVWQDWAKQLPASYEEQQWDAASASWGEDARFTFTYAPNSYVELIEVRAGSNWVNEQRDTYSYDNFGNATGYVEESWSGGAWTKTDESKTLLAYGPNNEVLRAVNQELDVTTNTFMNLTRSNYGDFQTFNVNSSRNRALAANAALYPNPATSQAVLTLTGLQAQAPVATQVLNSVGQVVRTFTLPVQQGGIRHELQLSSLPAGVYTVRLQAAEGTVTQRVVKQ